MERGGRGPGPAARRGLLPGAEGEELRGPPPHGALPHVPDVLARLRVPLLRAPVEAQAGAPRWERRVLEAARPLRLGERRAVGAVVRLGVAHRLALELHHLRGQEVGGWGGWSGRGEAAGVGKRESGAGRGVGLRGLRRRRTSLAEASHAASTIVRTASAICRTWSESGRQQKSHAHCLWAGAAAQWECG